MIPFLQAVARACLLVWVCFVYPPTLRSQTLAFDVPHHQQDPAPAAVRLKDAQLELQKN
jgi:hypothetical protein